MVEEKQVEHQEQMVVESVELTDDDDNNDAEQVNNADDGSGSANDGDAEEQDDELSQDSENDVIIEQSVGVQSQNQTAATENANVHQRTENGQQPRAANGNSMMPPPPPPPTVKAPILPANTIDLTHQAPVSAAGDVRRRQCIHCEESFFKVSSLYNHLKSDHGIIMKSVNKPAKEKVQVNENETGRYVRNPQAIKRKRTSQPKSDTDDDMDTASVSSQPSEKRKPMKSPTEPSLRRSFSRQ